MKKKRDQLQQRERDIKICFGTRKLLDAQNRPKWNALIITVTLTVSVYGIFYEFLHT